MASNASHIRFSGKFRLLCPNKSCRLVSAYYVSTDWPKFTVAAYNSACRYVPETSRYTLEELDNVFNHNTTAIVQNGWTQIRWLLTLGWRRGDEDPYPELVQREADSVFDDLHGPIELDVIVNQEE